MKRSAKVQWGPSVWTNEEKDACDDEPQVPGWNCEVTGDILIIYAVRNFNDASCIGRTRSLADAIDVFHERWYPLPIGGFVEFFTPYHLIVGTVEQKKDGVGQCFGTRQLFEALNSHGGFDQQWLLDWELQARMRYAWTS